jgi:hypothetical protein
MTNDKTRKENHIKGSINSIRDEIEEKK